MTDKLDLPVTERPGLNDTVMYEIQDGTGTPSGLFKFGRISFIHGNEVVIVCEDSAGFPRYRREFTKNTRVVLREREV